eukprot:CAMPEP_0197899430 /NCGR_PEP_ID=MMETSP1439-20131203/46485_1 /TAXON_ID=66791 /ORGANISM="Gonyaulax spinifera, Strain CCMP409" /LENGTH=48 /DNA_ID= /DNA_START= /DNA_END= /DNA_ORIENTATION=
MRAWGDGPSGSRPKSPPQREDSGDGEFQGRRKRGRSRSPRASEAGRWT